MVMLYGIRITPIGLEMCSPAGVEDGIGDRRQSKADGGGRVDVLPHIAHLEPQDALDFLNDRCFLSRVLHGLAEAVE
jgi:hypothetical protein